MPRLLLLLALLSGLPCLAQTAPDQGFFIEDIRIVSAHPRNTDLLLSALQLAPGNTYSEFDLRLGVYRLESLRFVLQADMQLLRGSTRGAYVLQVTITESKRFFYVLLSELGHTRDDFLKDDDDVESPTDPETGVRLSGLTVGKRWFPGRRGELDVFFPFYPGISYTHYNLFNRNVVASLALQYPGGFGKNFSAYPEQERLTRVEEKETLGVTFSMGIPLTPAQRLSFNYKLNAGEIERTQPVGREELVHAGSNFRAHKAELVWRYDTKDHPLFPTSGTVYAAGFLLDREYRNAANDDPLVPYDQLAATGNFLQGTARHYWNYRADRTLSFGVLARVGRTFLDTTDPDPDFLPVADYDTSKLGLNLLQAQNILNVPFLGKPRDFRLEAELSYEFNRSTLPDDYFPAPDFDRFQARLGITGRDHWGLIRLSLVYRSVNQELWQ